MGESFHQIRVNSHDPRMGDPQDLASVCQWTPCQHTLKETERRQNDKENSDSLNSTGRRKATKTAQLQAHSTSRRKVKDDSEGGAVGPEGRSSDYRR